jgi:putative acetyltransferase
MTIRKIKEADNAVLYEIIKTVMGEFNVNPMGTILSDPTVKYMYSNYNYPGSVYYVAEENNKVIGGCGVNKLYGGPDDTCELQRLFLLPSARGKGYGKLLLNLCISDAIAWGFKKMYLESLSQMKNAISLYESVGFEKVKEPLGNTGHGGCNIFMVMKL